MVLTSWFGSRLGRVHSDPEKFFVSIDFTRYLNLSRSAVHMKALGAQILPQVGHIVGSWRGIIPPHISNEGSEPSRDGSGRIPPLLQQEA